MINNQIKVFLKACVISLVVVILVPFEALALVVDDVAGNLICQCGCTMVVTSCQCGTADQMRTLIQGKIDKGETKEMIIKYFVDQYGEKVLASPTKKGFNLTAWITPFVAILLGGAIIFFLVRRWVSSRQAVNAEVQEVTAFRDYDEKYRKKLDDELRSFE